MSPRRQLRLVFSQSVPQSALLKMSLSSSRTRSRPSESPFLRKMRELERLSPAHADALGGIAEAIMAQILGAPLE